MGIILTFSPYMICECGHGFKRHFMGKTRKEDGCRDCEECTGYRPTREPEKDNPFIERADGNP